MVTYSSSYVFSNSALNQILDDLCVRFIMNLPPEEMHLVERVCFQIEEAQWYYEDFVRGHNPSLPTLNLRSFASKIFQHCPSLHEWKDSHEQAMNQFIAYKSRVPVRGAILLNKDLDQCVLVKGMRSSASWGFPRGKINQDEMDDVCAVREVLEETGYDASELINPDWFIENSIRDQSIRLYVIPGVPLDSHFAPRTRNEIGTIQWHHLSDLPTFSKRKDNSEGSKMGKFYLVAPFLPQLRKWIQSEGAQWKRAHGQENIMDIPSLINDDQNGVNLEETLGNDIPATYQTSSASLHSLLGIHAESVPDPVSNQADAAAKLKNLLCVSPDSGDAPPSNISTNGHILLSLLQSGTSPKKAEPRPRSNLPLVQPPVTPTRTLVLPSPSSTISHQTDVSRKPLSPLFDSAPAQQQTATYTSPNFKSRKPPATAPEISTQKIPGSYSQAQPSTDVLMAGLQSQVKPVVMTEQATALLKTLTSTNSPPRQPPQELAPLSSPLNTLLPSESQKPIDTQQKHSLLSILKGDHPTAAPIQQVGPPIAQTRPAAQTHEPPFRDPSQQTPPRAKSQKPTERGSNQQYQTSLSPHRSSRSPRTVRNADFPRQAPATQLLYASPKKEVLLKCLTPPLEPYINSPIGASGVPLNGVSPLFTRSSVNTVFDRRETADQQQQQTLLALLKKPSIPILKPEVEQGPVQPVKTNVLPDGKAPISAKFRATAKKVQRQQAPPIKVKVGDEVNLPRNGGVAVPSASRNALGPGAAVAFAKDAFLLSYLEGVAKNAGK